MPNKIKYNKTKRSEIMRLYSIGRSEGGDYTDGSRYYSKGKYTLKQIAERTGATISAVNAIAKGVR